MKLLLDQNLPSSLVKELGHGFRDSKHVKDFGLNTANDRDIWDFAKADGFTVISKDGDFQQLSFLLGAPPKVIWLKVGNCSTAQIKVLISERAEQIESFALDAESALLIIP